MSGPSIFISYAHEDADLARALAQALRRRKCWVWIDEGEMRVGDSLIERIATAIQEVEFVVALVSEASVESNWCKKELSLAITGGLGREGVKVLPLRVGEVDMPPALADTFWLALNPSSVSDAAARIKKDAEAHLADEGRVRRPAPAAARASAPVLPRTPVPQRTSSVPAPEPGEFEPIKLVGIVREGVGQPRHDGTRGSALYRIPLRLSHVPSSDWAHLFEANWDRPPSWTSMHRPGISRVSGDTVVLDGTTMEELERYHLKTLKLALNVTNERYAEHLRKMNEQERREREERERHERGVDDIASRLHFDDDE
jgi:TIR domain